MKNLFIITSFMFVMHLGAQTSPSVIVPNTNRGDSTRKDSTEEVLSFVEIMPSFPGGQTAFVKYLQENIKYPKIEKRYGKQGTVYVSFIVNKDGSISDVKVKKGVEGAPGLSAEAVRVMSTMPNWTPGTINGRPVRVQMTQPITFTLEDGKKKKDKGN